ncbi:MAG TPA: biotin/lipoyl-containing protein [Ktedonobacterales bacterium]|nr:biotin/lipoyl-containing protein [Ktedonobacterales bacterium]
MTERQLLVSRVKALIEALEGSDIAELDLTEGGTRILVRRRLDGVTVQVATPSYQARAKRATSPRTPQTEEPAAERGVAVVAPLTGMFYSRPSPSSESFVQLGETIQPGQVICIVEAMKVFNEIKSEVSGTVIAIVPKDGDLVQKGDALIRVKPV